MPSATGDRSQDVASQGHGLLAGVGWRLDSRSKGASQPRRFCESVDVRYSTGQLGITEKSSAQIVSGGIFILNFSGFFSS